MAISTRAAYIYDENLVLQAQGSLTLNSETGIYAFSEEEAQIQQGEIGTVQIVIMLPNGTLTTGTPLISFRTKEGYGSSLLQMSTAENWQITVDGSTTTYQTLYITMSVVGWTYHAGRHALQAVWLYTNGTLEKIPMVFYTVQNGVDNFEELTADTYEEIATAFDAVYDDLLERLSNIELFNLNALGYNNLLTQGGAPLLRLISDSADEAILTYNGRDVVVDYQGVNAELFKNLFVEVKASGAIANGDVVQYTGAVGVSGRIYVKKAVPAEVNANPHLIVGVATHAFANGENGLVNWYGAVNDLDTSTYTAGDVIYYASESATAGQFTKTKPTAPNVQIKIGVVTIVHATQGQIKLRPEIGRKLADLHDVHYNGHVFTADDLLVYDTVDNRWEVKTKTAYLASIQSQIDQHTSDIADRELRSNKVNEVVVTGTTDQYVNAAALYAKFLTKVDKAFTIAGLDMQSGSITKAALKAAIGEAGDVNNLNDNGLLSYADKTLIDVLRASYSDDDGNSLVDTIKEVLAAFDGFPETTDLMAYFATKVDKVEGKGLSENDLTDELKTQYDDAVVHANTTDGTNPHLTTYANIASKPTTFEGFGLENGSVETIEATTHVKTPKVILATGVYIEYNATDGSIDFVIE